VAVGVGDARLRFDLDFGVGLGDGVGETFFRFGVAVGDGPVVVFFAERVLCFRCGDGVGVGSKIFLIFVPNESSTAFAASIAPNNSAKITSGPTNLRAAMDRKALNTCLSVCHSEPFDFAQDRLRRGISDFILTAR